MKRYVVGIILNIEGTHALLIRKTKPKWQEGLLNGIGGKIEKGESSIEAMQRECLEETGLDIKRWIKFAQVTVNNEEYSCTIFKTRITLDEMFIKRYHIADSGEKLVLIKLSHLAVCWDECIHNLEWLIPLAATKRCITTAILFEFF